MGRSKNQLWLLTIQKPLLTVNSDIGILVQIFAVYYIQNMTCTVVNITVIIFRYYCFNIRIMLLFSLKLPQLLHFCLWKPLTSCLFISTFILWSDLFFQLEFLFECFILLLYNVIDCNLTKITLSKIEKLLVFITVIS